jgi:hypothetical protein
MLAFLPIIGPIIQGISSIFAGYFNQKVQLKQADVQQDIAESQVSAQIIHDTQDSIGLRLMRDLVCFPVVVWSSLIGWDTIIANTKYNTWMWHVANYPDSVSYLPYAVLVFLLGNIGINMWSRK